MELSMFDALRRLHFSLREWWFSQPVSLSREAQEDWAAQPIPRTERAIRKEIRRLKLVKLPCEHLEQRLWNLEDRLPYVGLLKDVPPMPPRRRAASTEESERLSLH